MHKLECKYGDYSDEGGCSVIVKGGEPYLLLNLEMLYKLCKGKNICGPHGDFTYIMFKNNRFCIFIVELKSIKENSDKSLNNILDSSVEKFRNSLTAVNNFARQNLNIRGIGIECYAVLVLPSHAVNRIKVLLSHFKMKFRSLREAGYEDCWITHCGRTIWDRVVPLME